MKTKHNDPQLAFIEYEVSGSWWASWISWNWLQKIIGKYFAWKVTKKYRRYKKYLKLKNIDINSIDCEKSDMMTHIIQYQMRRINTFEVSRHLDNYTNTLFNRRHE